jgi:DNA repair protein RadC
MPPGKETEIMKKLHVDDGAGFRAATIDEILEGARAALAQKVRRGTSMASPKLATDYLTMRLGDRG